IDRYIAKSMMPVLIVGETGTGKESIAREIHQKSGLPSERFRAVNCAAFTAVDLAEERGVRAGRWEDYVRQELTALSFCPMSFISAREGTNVGATLALAEELFGQAGFRAQTSELNRVLQLAKRRRSPRDHGRWPKLFYATQVDVHPPTLLVFVNSPSEFTGAYDRYLQNQLRKELAWREIPIRLVYRKRTKVELPPE
ncbi:MAG: sigma 54-interacting transcriptional regulator, partial [Planctomycetota bacterium]